jgi:pyridoxal phosphate enzyme (YggS family)
VSDSALADTLARNLETVRTRLVRAASTARRDPADIRLIAVSKTFSADHVRAAAAAGQADFGENRIQEALPKIQATADLPLRWHLIGHLQSNKARKAVGPFAAIHSVDGVELLSRLDGIAREERRRVDVLIQVDLAGEETKFGLDADALGPLFALAQSLEGARVVGLMLLPPFFEDPERVRPFFRRLRELRDGLLDAGTPSGMLRELSMGMSHDFEVAVEEGATMVRVGTAIFGERS